MYDHVDDHGILVQDYGPHTFHTKEKYLLIICAAMSSGLITS